MVGWHHQLDEHEFEQAPGDGKGQGSLVLLGFPRLDRGLIAVALGSFKKVRGEGSHSVTFLINFHTILVLLGWGHLEDHWNGMMFSMRVARGSASWLSSHGRGLGPRDALKKDSRPCAWRGGARPGSRVTGGD